MAGVFTNVVLEFEIACTTSAVPLIVGAREAVVVTLETSVADFREVALRARRNTSIEVKKLILSIISVQTASTLTRVSARTSLTRPVTGGFNYKSRRSNLVNNISSCCERMNFKLVRNPSSKRINHISKRHLEHLRAFDIVVKKFTNSDIVAQLLDPAFGLFGRG